jgi:predicted transcriptional regulator
MSKGLLVTQTRAAVEALANLGVGTRESARLLGMTPSHVAYYRKGIPPPAREDVYARLPLEVKLMVTQVKKRRLRVPYPEHCSHPEKCAGKGNCQRDPNCID